MSQAGERPGQGRYTCVICGNVVFLEGDEDTLEQCPNCGSERYAP